MARRSAIQEYGEKKKDINVVLSRKAIATLDAVAEAVGTSRSDAIERFARGYEMPLVEGIEVDAEETEIQARINVTLTPTVISRLTAWGEDLGSNRSDMVERLVLRQYCIQNGTPVHYQGQFQLQLLQ